MATFYYIEHYVHSLVYKNTKTFTSYIIKYIIVAKEVNNYD